MSTLSESIFGSKVKSSSSLFNASNSLPDKPHFVNFTEPKRSSENSHRSKRKLSEKTDTLSTDRSSGKKQKAQETSIIEHATETENAANESSNVDKEKIIPSNIDESKEEALEHDDQVDEKTIFVANLPLEITRGELASIFKPCGKVISARLRSVATSGVKVSTEMAGNAKFVKKIAVNTKAYLTESPKKFAQGYVVFSDVEAVHKALAMNNQTISISIGSASNPVAIKLRVDHSKPTVDASRSVFVGNLPYAADEQSLRQHFNTVCGWNDEDDHPMVDSVRIIRDPSTMQCKGFGYVLLKDKISVPDALRKAHQTSYLKREIRVVVCGRRFKSQNVNKQTGGSTQTQGRNFEGTRSTSTSTLLNSASRRIMKKSKTQGGGDSTKKTILALKKSFEKTAQKGTKIRKDKGRDKLSKTAALKKKVEKRTKKIEMRVNKGMGKNKSTK